jgi:hypothetical protein
MFTLGFCLGAFLGFFLAIVFVGGSQVSARRKEYWNEYRMRKGEALENGNTGE